MSPLHSLTRHLLCNQKFSNCNRNSTQNVTSVPCSSHPFHVHWILTRIQHGNGKTKSIPLIRTSRQLAQSGNTTSQPTNKQQNNSLRFMGQYIPDVLVPVPHMNINSLQRIIKETKVTTRQAKKGTNKWMNNVIFDPRD